MGRSSTSLAARRWQRWWSLRGVSTIRAGKRGGGGAKRTVQMLVHVGLGERLRAAGAVAAVARHAAVGQVAARAHVLGQLLLTHAAWTLRRGACCRRLVCIYPKHAVLRVRKGGATVESKRRF